MSPDQEQENTSISLERAQRIVMLRGSIKLLFGIGFLFLLVPFFQSIPWPETEAPEGSLFVSNAELPPGHSAMFTLADGSTFFVTRSTEPLRHSLESWPADRLWFPTAPGLLQQEWWVVGTSSSVDEALTLQPRPSEAWPQGFSTASGARWDVAGRALKPDATQADAYTMKTLNLALRPFRAVHQKQGSGILLLPTPEPVITPSSTAASE